MFRKPFGLKRIVHAVLMCFALGAMADTTQIEAASEELLHAGVAFPGCRAVACEGGTKDSGIHEGYSGGPL